MTRTTEELSIVCPESTLPDKINAERDWIALKLQGPFAFSLSGVLVAFAQPLAEAQIGIFAISTFDTDYVLIKRESQKRAIAVLTAAGHEQLEPS